MIDGQEFIYYACGESYDKIDKLPKIEKVKDKGYEVLYFKDGVDDFVAKILMDYDGKKFKSVSEENFSVDTDEEKQQVEKKSEENKDLLQAIKENLGDKVKEVRLTANFKNYPVCLTAVGDISIEMEKVFKTLPNADGKMKAEKILEISLEHGILASLEKAFKEDKEKLKKYSLVLYEQARILAGLDIEDSNAFVLALSEII
jgi:molecular chaperone HtpG